MAKMDFSLKIKLFSTVVLYIFKHLCFMKRIKKYNNNTLKGKEYLSLINCTENQCIKYLTVN